VTGSDILFPRARTNEKKSQAPNMEDSEPAATTTTTTKTKTLDQTQALALLYRKWGLIEKDQQPKPRPQPRVASLRVYSPLHLDSNLNCIEAETGALMFDAELPLCFGASLPLIIDTPHDYTISISSLDTPIQLSSLALKGDHMKRLCLHFLAATEEAARRDEEGTMGIAIVDGAGHEIRFRVRMYLAEDTGFELWESMPDVVVLPQRPSALSPDSKFRFIEVSSDSLPQASLVYSARQLFEMNRRTMKPTGPLYRQIPSPPNWRLPAADAAVKSEWRVSADKRVTNIVWAPPEDESGQLFGVHMEGGVNPEEEEEEDDRLVFAVLITESGERVFVPPYSTIGRRHFKLPNTSAFNSPHFLDKLHVQVLLVEYRPASESENPWEVCPTVPPLTPILYRTYRNDVNICRFFDRPGPRRLRSTAFQEYKFAHPSAHSVNPLEALAEWQLSPDNDLLLAALIVDGKIALSEQVLENTDQHGRSLLHYCALFEMPCLLGAVIQELGWAAVARQGVSKRDVNGRTPLHIAYAFGNLRCKQILELAGANLDCTDVKGYTPAELAQARGISWLSPWASTKLREHSEQQFPLAPHWPLLFTSTTTDAKKSSDHLEAMNDKGVAHESCSRQAQGPEVKHMVVAMFDRRSFDSLHGFVYDCRHENIDDEQLLIVGRDQTTPFNGVSCDLPAQRCTVHTNRAFFPGANKLDTLHPSEIAPGSMDEQVNVSRLYQLPRGRLGSSLERDAAIQFYGDPAQRVDDSRRFDDSDECLRDIDHHLCQNIRWLSAASSPAPTMRGFVQRWIQLNPKLPEDVLYDSVRCHGRQTAPVLNLLARQYACSDDYFSSLPSDSWTNRLAAFYPSSLGIVQVGTADEAHLAEQHLRAMLPHSENFMQRLSRETEGRFRWQAVAPRAPPTGIPLDSLFLPLSHSHYHQIPRRQEEGKEEKEVPRTKTIQEAGELARQGKLPAFTFVDLMTPVAKALAPADPGTRMTVKEIDQAVLELYHALFVAAPPNCAEHTLFVVTFADSGGLFEHVVPPRVVPPAENARTSLISPRTLFYFDRLGPRVPLLLISPYIRERTLLRRPSSGEPLSHAAIEETAERLFGNKTSSSSSTFLPALTLSLAREDAAQVYELLKLAVSNMRPNESTERIEYFDEIKDAEVPHPDALTLMSQRLLLRVSDWLKQGKIEQQEQEQEQEEVKPLDVAAVRSLLRDFIRSYEPPANLTELYKEVQNTYDLLREIDNLPEVEKAMDVVKTLTIEVSLAAAAAASKPKDKEEKEQREK
jgi:hypothetical protein